MPAEPSPYEKDLARGIQEWRVRHRLAEDDVVFLLVELFGIHQRHWDALRRKDLPSLEQFRTDITKLVDACRSLRQETATVIGCLKSVPANPGGRITRTAAWLAALAGALAGYLLGRAWP